MAERATPVPGAPPGTAPGAPPGTAPAGLAERYPPLPSGGLLMTVLRLMLLNVKARLEYRADFVMNLLSGFLYQLMGIAFIWVVLTRFPDLAGWRFGEIAFLYSIRLMAHGLYLPFFWNIMEMSGLIRSGDMDRLLIRPVNPLILVITRSFQMNSVGDFLMAVLLFIVAQAHLHLAWGPLQVLFLIGVLCSGVLIEAGLQLFISSLAVWFVAVQELNWWADELFNTFGNYPIRIYTRAIQFSLTWVVPLAFVAYLPSSLLLNKTEGSLQATLAYGAPLVGVLFFWLNFRFFRFALRHYRSTGQ